MSLPIVLRPEARREFDDIFDWYEEQRSGAGDAFAAAVLRTLNQIERMPESHALVFEDIRRAVVSRFLYLVYYRVLPDHVVVIALVHGKRDRGYWRSRT